MNTYYPLLNLSHTCDHIAWYAVMIRIIVKDRNQQQFCTKPIKTRNNLESPIEHPKKQSHV